MNFKLAIKTRKFESEKHKLVLNILYRAWAITSYINRKLKQYGISYMQYYVIPLFKGSFPITMRLKDICSRLIESGFNISRIIDMLEDKKLVKRLSSPNDNRKTLINLIPAGIKLLEVSARSIQPSTIQSLTITEKNRPC